MIDTVLFDLDGTLVDSAPGLALAANLQREKCYLPPLPFEELRVVASMGTRGLLKAALELEQDALVYPYFRDSFLADYRNCMLDNSHFFPRITELLDALEQRNIIWGIVTNKSEALSQPLFDYLKITGRSHVNVCGDTTPYFKPEPGGLIYAAEQIGKKPSQCVYIGDDERDIIAGKDAGMKTIAVTYGYSLDVAAAIACKPDAIAHHPAEITTLLLGDANSKGLLHA
ncbi:MAG: HAD-IA family hydrolase [Alcaligenaceae bacterium]|jgi:phosphoglycolate phosphatase|nr:HAD-IA family hydrolase [Alcaligenaceae bacterium]